MFYNIPGVRAVGDSRHPLYFPDFPLLSIPCSIFVLSFPSAWGIARGALATVIAQCLSAVLTLHVLTTTDGPYRICWKKLCMDCLCCTASSASPAGSDPADGARFKCFRAVLYIIHSARCYGRLSPAAENRPVYDVADDECWSCFDHLHRTERRCQLHIDRAKKGS